MSLETTTLGRVAAPPGHESTSGTFHFWIDRDQQVERTQLVTTSSMIGGQLVKFLGIVQEVYRCSRQRNMAEEAARYDSRSSESVPFDSEGVTYAEVTILRTIPVVYAPPQEESEVMLASEEEARQSYGLDEVEQLLNVGLIKNGGTRLAGMASIDIDYLLGKNGGHLNVNGIAGLGTKSSLLMLINWLLLREAEKQQRERPSDGDRLQVAPIVFNVKNYDLFHLDKPNKNFAKRREQYLADWKAMGVEEPRPFTKLLGFAPQMKDLDVPANVGRTDNLVLPYSWSLSDIIEHRLFRFLFSEDDIYDTNFGGLVGEMEEFLTSETNSGPKLRQGDDYPTTFDGLLNWFKDNKKESFTDFTQQTKGKLLRRLIYIIKEGDGVLRRNDERGRPLLIPNGGLDGPMVIDLYALNRTPSLQRFVVAAVLHQIVQHRTGNRSGGLRFLITIDELNRFAPRGSSDPITEQINLVAAEMRSQGVILLGAQQQASLVSSKVIENAAIRAVGRSGALEMGAEVWKFLSPSARQAAAQLQPEEKLLYQPTFREPMLTKIPYPPWALSQNEVDVSTVPLRKSRADQSI